MRLPRMPRPIYILYRLAESLLASLSRFGNAAFFAGSTHQTISARCWIEGQQSPKWARRRRLVDALFFFQPEHCRGAWEAEVSNASKTLERNRALRPP